MTMMMMAMMTMQAKELERRIQKKERKENLCEGKRKELWRARASFQSTSECKTLSSEHADTQDGGRVCLQAHFIYAPHSQSACVLSA